MPSHLYCWSFERNPSWTKTYSDAPEIWNYFDKVYKKYGVEKFVRFSTRVNECVWNDETGKWKVFLKDVNTGEAFEDECDVS